MHYLIDGHNLIGKLPGLSLDDPNDEIMLVQLLKRWCAADGRRKVTVVFDAGLPGGEAKHLSGGNVRVVFAPNNRTADAILIRHIEQIKDLGAYTVVSSDNAISRAARQQRVSVQRSEAFATAMMNDRMFRSPTAPSAPAPEPERPHAESMSADELSEWLELFGPEPERPTPPPRRPTRPPTAAELQQEKARRKKEEAEKKQAAELDEWLRLFGYKE